MRARLIPAPGVDPEPGTLDPVIDETPPGTGTGRPGTGATDAGRSPWVSLTPLLVGFFMIIMSSSVVAVAIPTISSDLDASADATLWTSSGYLLALTSPLLLAGRLGDRLGLKNVYQVGLVVFVVASLLCGLSGTIEQLIAARVAQGLGSALMTPQSLSIITRLFPAGARGPAMGAWGATSGVALLAGPLLGGLLIQAFGGQWIFFVNVPLGVLTLVLVGLFVPSMTASTQRLDLLGAALSALGITVLVYALQQGPTYGWGPILGWFTIPMLVAAGVAVLVVFVAWQRSPRNPSPLLPLSLFRNRNFTLADLAVFGGGFVINSLPLPVLLWAQDAKGASPFESALIIAPTAVLTTVLAPVVGRVVDRVPIRWITLSGFVGLSASIVWMSLLVSAGAPPLWLLFPAALLGVSSSCMWGPLAVGATAAVPEHLAGAGSGTFNTMRQLGGVFGIAGISATMQAIISTQLPDRTVAGDGGAGFGSLPPGSGDAFGTAMGQSLLVPALAAVVAAVAAGLLSNRTGVTPPTDTATAAVDRTSPGPA